MGTPLPPIPPDPGDLCTTCWGDDGVFGKVTSRVLSIQLFDLEEGAFWAEVYREELLTPTDLIQNEFFPCFFANITTNFQWFVDYGPGGTIVVVELRFIPNRDAFLRITVDECTRTGANDLTAPGGVIAFGGTFSMYLGVP